MENIKRKNRYGVSSKFAFGSWRHIVYGPFESDEQAYEWLYTEQYDFRERELMSKTAAINLVGRRGVENAIEPCYLSL